MFMRHIKQDLGGTRSTEAVDHCRHVPINKALYIYSSYKESLVLVGGLSLIYNISYNILFVFSTI